MSKAKHTTTKSERFAYEAGDEPLIEQCVAFAGMLGASATAFKADPNGNCAYAQEADDKYRRNMWKHLSAASSLPAKTASGLASKARVVTLVLGDATGGNLEDDAYVFLVKFAEDVKRMAEDIVSEQWSAALRAAKGGAA